MKDHITIDLSQILEDMGLKIVEQDSGQCSVELRPEIPPEPVTDPEEELPEPAEPEERPGTRVVIQFDQVLQRMGLEGEEKGKEPSDVALASKVRGWLLPIVWAFLILLFLIFLAQAVPQVVTAVQEHNRLTAGIPVPTGNMQADVDALKRSLEMHSLIDQQTIDKIISSLQPIVGNLIPILLVVLAYLVGRYQKNVGQT